MAGTGLGVTPRGTAHRGCGVGTRMDSLVSGFALSFEASVGVVRGAPERSVSRIGGGQRRKAQACAGVFPPVAELILQVHRPRTRGMGSPVKAFTAEHHEPVAVFGLPFSAGVRLVRARPMGDFVRTVARSGRVSATSSAKPVHAIPKSAITANGAGPRFGCHGLFPK